MKTNDLKFLKLSKYLRLSIFKVLPESPYRTVKIILLEHPPEAHFFCIFEYAPNKIRFFFQNIFRFISKYYLKKHKNIEMRISE